jgi:mRNA-degrading endonuclease RelE of RelBE toxin-antitoxin system
MHRVRFGREAQKALARLPRDQARRIRTGIEKLARDPRTPNLDVRRDSAAFDFGSVSGG